MNDGIISRNNGGCRFFTKEILISEQACDRLVFKLMSGEVEVLE